MPTKAIQRCIDALCAQAFQRPHFLLVHSKVRDLYVEDKTIPTMCINEKGQIRINPDFVMGLPSDQLGAVICHELMHLALDYFGRMGSRDPKIWNFAHDMAINHALRADGLKLPPKALYPPPEYKGPLYAEPIYDWLTQNQDQQPQQGDQEQGEGSGQGGQGQGEDSDDSEGQQGQGGQGKGQGKGQGRGRVTEGCGVDRAPAGQGQGQGGQAQGPAENWNEVWQGAKTVARSAGIGEGSSAVLDLITPKPPRINWRKVLKSGFSFASTHIDMVSQTFSRRHRRSPAEGAQLPGWIGANPRIAILVDVSSSMDREWVGQIVGEIFKLQQAYRGSKAYLVTHTDRVCWQGWVADGSRAAILESVKHEGGTSAYAAYRAAAEIGRFDALIHFTDCELPGEWPAVPARKLIVGAFGSGADKPYCTPPAGAIVLPCGKDA